MDVLDVVFGRQLGDAPQQLAQRVHHAHHEGLGQLALVLVDRAVLVVEVPEVLPDVGDGRLGPERGPRHDGAGDGQGDGEGDTERAHVVRPRSWSCGR